MSSRQTVYSKHMNDLMIYKNGATIFKVTEKNNSTCLMPLSDKQHMQLFDILTVHIIADIIV